MNLEIVAHFGRLERRYAPRHVHLSDGSIEGVADPPDAMDVLNRIEARFRRGQRE